MSLLFSYQLMRAFGNGPIAALEKAIRFKMGRNIKVVDLDVTLGVDMAQPGRDVSVIKSDGETPHIAGKEGAGRERQARHD